MSWNYLSKVISNNYYIRLLDIYYLDENIIVTSGYVAFSSVLYQSTDGGVTWSFKFYGGSSDSYIGYNKTQFINSTTGFLLANGGMSSMYYAYIYKTSNSGTSWAKINNSGLPLCRSIFMLDEINGYTVGNDQAYLGTAKPNAVYKTNDGGINWTQQVSSTTEKLNDVYFTDINNGVIVGDNGIVRRTSTGGVTGMDKEIITNVNFALHQNYPNPFNPITTISYELPKAGKVSIKIFDLLGREITTLVDEYKNAGSYEVEFKANYLPSGVYFYQLKTGDYIFTKKMVLLK